MLNFDQNEYKIANRLCSDHLQQGCGEIQIREHDVKQKKKKKKKKKSRIPEPKTTNRKKPSTTGPTGNALEDFS
jgi:hypothetical protein